MELKNVKDRFVDENYSKYAFSDKVLVCCPRCKKRAEVTYDRETNSKIIKCFECHFIEKGDDLIYENRVKRNCDNCGGQILVEVESKNKMDKMKVKCHACGQTREYKPTITTKRIIFKDNGNATDPHYGLPLWLQGDIKGNIFWAYNYEHLNYLKRYVAAKIRERASPTYMTLIARLPDFIKSAKNREKLIKLIEKLELKK